MNKKELFYKYTDWTALQGIGAGWIAQIKGYLPIGDWITKSSIYWIALGAVNIKWIPFWAVVVFIALKFYLMMFVNWFVGKFIIKSGVYEAQQQYGAKKEHLSPYNLELIGTLEEICKALNIKSKFTKL